MVILSEKRYINTGYIKKHQNLNQIEGLAQNNGKDGKEVIATLSIIESKMLVVNDLRTNEKFHFLHKEGLLYVMNGYQKITTHQKLTDKLRGFNYCTVWPHLKSY